MIPMAALDTLGMVLAGAIFTGIAAVFVAGCAWIVLALTPSIIEHYKIAKAAIKNLEDKP